MTVYNYPIKRTNFLFNARFEGADDDLDFKVDYKDAQGVTQTAAFRPGETGQGVPGICLPSSKTVNDLMRDVIVAHIRMGTLISKLIPGSTEWMNIWVGESPQKNLQTSIGDVVITEFNTLNDDSFKIKVKKDKTQNPVREVQIDYSEVSIEEYSFAPSTQAVVIAGSLEVAYPAYVHDPPSNPLSSSEKQNIIDYVNGLEIWI